MRFRAFDDNFAVGHRVADVSGDGNPDVILRYGNFSLAAVDGLTTNPLWSFGSIPAPFSDCFLPIAYANIAVGDVDDDGIPEIVSPVYCGRDGDSMSDRLIVLNARTGVPRYLTERLSVDATRTGGYAWETFPTIARLAPGESPSIVIGASARNNFGDCSAYVDGAPGQGSYCRFAVTIDGATGAIRKRMFAAMTSTDASFDGPAHRWNPPIVFDLDGDGEVEIVSAGAVFHRDGSVQWNESQTVYRTAIANLDDTPDTEVVMLLGGGNGSLDSIQVYKSNGELLWNFPLFNTNIFQRFTIADVDRDGFPEVMLGLYSYGDGRDVMIVLDHLGQVKWIRNFAPDSGSNLGSDGRPAVYDLDDDGVPEVLVLSGLGLDFLDGTDGTTKYTYPLPRANYYDGLIPTIADLDGNGHAEVVFSRPAGSAASPENTNLGGLFVLKAPSDDWRPVQHGLMTQYAYYGGNVGDDGAIPFPQPDVFATPRTNVFGTQAPYPYLSSFVGRDETTFLYEATDGTFTAPAQVTIDIAPLNRPPVFTTTPPTVYDVNLPVHYPARAVDPDTTDTVTYSLLAGNGDQAGQCHITAATGDFDCNPLPRAFGRVDLVFTILATDGHGGTASQVIRMLPSTGATTVPKVVGLQQAAAESAITSAGLVVGGIASVQSPFPAGQVLSQSPTGGRPALNGSAVSMVVSLGPPADPRDVDDDGDSYSENQGDCDDTAPARNPGAADTVGNDVDENCDGIDGVLPIASIAVAPTSPLVITGETRAFTATAILTDGTTADVTSVVVWSSSQPGVAGISPAGVATAYAAGPTTIGAARSGVSGSTTLTVAARVAGDQTGPVAVLTSPATDAEVTEPVDVIGTATDANFLRYELAVAPAGETAFTTLATGTSPVTNGVLGSLDPTLLVNDQYTLRLTTFDRGGNTATAEVVVQVARERKVGLFTIGFLDLSVAVSGVPISVSRTYDSRDKRTGDFGVGWSLNLETLRLRTNRVLGTGWVRSQAGAIVSLAPTDAHKVSLTLANGQVEEFDMQVAPTAGLGGLDFTTIVGFVPRPGTLGTLEALANPSLAILNGGAEDELVDDATFNTYDPQLWRYTGFDGAKVEIDRTLGVQKITDPNGNTLTFGPSGIVHSSGPGLSFVRDGAGRITTITDPEGHTRTYAYDAHGDLVSSTDQTGITTTYAYDHAHGLLKVVDPTGAPQVRNEYDTDGRLLASTDANGKTIQYTHDLGGRKEIVTDRLGHATTHEYDEVGNVTATVDALGHRTEFTYDARGNELTRKDALGRIATQTHDARNNVLTGTDFDGNTTTFTYDGRGHVLTTTDADGHVTTNVYDAAGNLKETTDPEGGVTKSTYDAAGNLATVTDPLLRVTTYGYDAAGRRTSVTNAAGHVTTYTYDDNGKQLTETRTRTLPGGGTQTLTTTNEYDAAGRITKVTDPLGGTTITTYDARGLKKTTKDPKGHVTTYEYDPAGRATTTTYADATTKTTTYDFEGRKLTVTDRDGHTTTYAYDEIGRQTGTTNPDGTTTSTTYDDVGRIETQTDERGHTTTTTYGVNQRTVTDALGHTTVDVLDGEGRRVQTTDALGHVYVFVNDGNGNLVETQHPDGTTRTTTYDLARQKRTDTDQAGVVTTFGYDALGRVTSVTDGAGETTTVGFDEVGNRITQTDANGHVTRMEYDGLGRLTKRIRPLGQLETFSYDPNGNQESHTDFNGDVTTYAYDVNDQLTTKTLPGNVVVPYAFSPEGPRTLAGGDGYTYDARHRLKTEAKAGGAVLTYGYDAKGNRTSVTSPEGTTTYTYDDLDRLATVTDATGTTTYGYDAVGNLTSTTYPNGVTSTYEYDVVNRLEKLTNADAGGTLSSYTYALGPVGNRTGVVEAGLAVANRTVVWDYDDLYRLTGETIDAPGSANDAVVAYAYDAVGNRISVERNGTVTTYDYDDNDRLLSETTGGVTTAYDYDANGNVIERSVGATVDQYDFDAENRLVSASLQSGPATGVTEYTYDADGLRTSRTHGGTTTSFLVDKNRPFGEVLAETTGATTVTYTHGHDLVAQTRPATGASFYLHDGQLSTRQLADDAGAVTDDYTYDAYGRQLAAAGTTPNRYRYGGEQLDDSTGFYYLRARYYDPASGRFVSTDPQQGSAFDPPSLHRYLYANANPVNVADPSGEFGLATVALISAVTLGLVIAGFFLIAPRLRLAANVEAKFNVDIVPVYRDEAYKSTGQPFSNANAEEVLHELTTIFQRGTIQIAGTVLAKQVAGIGSLGSAEEATERFGAGHPVIVLMDERSAFDEKNHYFYTEGEDGSFHTKIAGNKKGGIIARDHGEGGGPDISRAAAHLLGHCFGLKHAGWSWDKGNIMFMPPGSAITRDQAENARAFIRDSPNACK